MENRKQDLTELIAAFHLTWDNFPGHARLISKTNEIIAVNKVSQSEGWTPGQICAKIGDPETHRGCRKAIALSTGTAQVDRPSDEKIRGWYPVDGWPDLVVHFSVVLPEIN